MGSACSLGMAYAYLGPPILTFPQRGEGTFWGGRLPRWGSFDCALLGSGGAGGLLEGVHGPSGTSFEEAVKEVAAVGPRVGAAQHGVWNGFAALWVMRMVS